MSAAADGGPGAATADHRGPRLRAAAVVAVVVAALAALPLGVDEYHVLLLGQAFLFAIAAVSLDLVWGYAGVPDLGHAMWFGIGALGVGVATTTLSSTGLVTSVDHGIGAYALGLVGGVAAAALLAVIVGRLSLTSKLEDPFYIAVVTLALTIAAATLYTKLPHLTGGENGLFGFQAELSATTWYYVAGAILLLVVAGALVLVRSDFGVLVRAARDNHARLRYLGHSDVRVKRRVFVVGAALAALAGGLYGMMVGVIASEQFGFVAATQVLVWVAVGGRATVVGPAVAAVALGLVTSLLGESMPEEWTLIEGAMFVAVVVFLPAGLLSPLARPLRRWIGGGAGVAAGRRLVPAPPVADRRVGEPGSVQVALRDVRFSYGALQVLRGVDLDVRAGELLCVVGPNGAGKSTLTSIVTDGRLRIGGELSLWDGAPTHRGSTPERLARAGIGRKFQVPSLFATVTVAESLLLASGVHRRLSPVRRTRDVEVSGATLDVAEAMGLRGLENVSSELLAHGHKQALEIAMALGARPRVLLLDEPTAGLTAAERAVMGEIVRRLVGAGVATVLIEHDMDFVYDIADRVAVLDAGRVIEDGPPAQISASETVRTAYLGLEAQAPT